MASKQSLVAKKADLEMIRASAAQRRDDSVSGDAAPTEGKRSLSSRSEKIPAVAKPISTVVVMPKRKSFDAVPLDLGREKRFRM